jgi:hypothetical protein
MVVQQVGDVNTTNISTVGNIKAIKNAVVWDIMLCGLPVFVRNMSKLLP